MVHPIVSIVLPTYNRAGLIGRSIRSLLAQTESRLEVIVADDGSSDGTEQAVASLRDPRVRYLRMPANRGPAAARNAGVRASTAALLAFQDSDDEWEPDKLEKQLAALDAAGVETGVVTCDMRRFQAGGGVVYHRSPEVKRGRWLSPRTRFYQSYGLGIQSAVMRRELFVAAGGFEEHLHCFEDLELFLRLAQRCDFRRVPEPLVCYHETGGLTTQWKWELRARRWMLWRHGRSLIREDAGFWCREAALVAGRSVLGPVLRNWVGRPLGPEEDGPVQ